MKPQRIHRDAARVHMLIEISPEELSDVLRKGGLEIPEGMTVGVSPPTSGNAFEDPAPGSPYKIRWMEFE